MAVTSTLTLVDGLAAATALSNAAVAYVTPGNLETISLTTNTGVQQWTLTISSDYGPLNLGEFYKTNGPVFQVQIPMPNQPCKLFLTSECSDGNNVYFSTNTLLNYQRQTLVDRSVR